MEMGVDMYAADTESLIKSLQTETPKYPQKLMLGNKKYLLSVRKLHKKLFKILIKGTKWGQEAEAFRKKHKRPSILSGWKFE